MSLVRVASVKELDTDMGDTFGKVGLQTVGTHIDQCFQLAGVPLACRRVGEVDNCHTRLPGVPLPDIAVRSLEEVTTFLSLIEHVRVLRDVRVDPQTDLDVVLLLDLSQVRLGVRESFRVKGERAPIVSLHPAVSPK